MRIPTNVQPVAIHGNGAVREIELEYTVSRDGALKPTGEIPRLPADRVFRAIGQRLENTPDGLELTAGKIAVAGAGRTGLSGDCASGGDDLIVTAVAEGRDAAMDSHNSQMG